MKPYFIMWFTGCCLISLSLKDYKQGKKFLIKMQILRDDMFRHINHDKSTKATQSLCKISQIEKIPSKFPFYPLKQVTHMKESLGGANCYGWC